MRKTETTEALGICWTNLPEPYKGCNLNVTVRDGGEDEARASLQALKNIIDDEIGEPEEIKRVAGSVEVARANFSDVPLVSAPGDLGLLEYPPKAADRNPGDVYEIQVQKYTRNKKKISFYIDDNEDPAHNHYLSDYGKGQMSQIFTDKWDEIFTEAADPKGIYNGDVILRILISDKKHQQYNFYYANLVNQRRP